MANVIGDIAISIGADIGPLVTAMARGEASVSKFGVSTEASAAKVKAFSLAGLAMAGVVTGLSAGLGVLVKRAIDNAGALHDLSAKTGIHVAALQAMTQVADEASVSQEQLSAGIVKMQVSLANLRDGVKLQTEAFDKLGLSYSSFAGLSPDQAFAKIADAIAAIKDPTRQTAEAVAIFGKSGADLIPMMQGFSAAVADAAQHQRDLGVAMSDTDTATLDNLGDSFGRLKDAAAGAATQFAITFGPAMQEAVNAVAFALRDAAQALHSTTQDSVDLAKNLRMDEVKTSAEDAAGELEKMALSFAGLADGSISNALRAQAADIRTQSEAFKLGAISADDYKTRINVAFERVNATISSIGILNGADMSGAIGQMNAYADAIGGALGHMMNLMNFGAGGDAPSGDTTLPPSGGDGPHRGGDSLTPPASKPGKPGHTSGGGGANKLADQLKALQDSVQTQAEIEARAYKDQQDTLQKALDKKLLTITEYTKLAEELQSKHQATMSSIDQEAWGGNANALAGYLGIAADTLQAGGDKMVRISRTISAAQALINTYKAASDVLAGPGTLFTKLAAVGAVIASGLSLVNSIKSGSSGGGGGGGASAAAAAQQAAPQPLQVRLTGFGPGDMFNGAMIGSLLDKLDAEAGDRGYRIMVAQ
ncbi:hypothetical protein GC209_14375 [bacterium]|nr:hypothetical protein [bacterium]